jgi:hypothetical protein
MSPLAPLSAVTALFSVLCDAAVVLLFSKGGYLLHYDRFRWLPFYCSTIHIPMVLFLPDPLCRDDVFVDVGLVVGVADRDC